MKRAAIILSALVALVALRWGYVQLAGSDDIEYRGQKIKLARKYTDYDEFKNDPRNLTPAERKRVEAMMTAAKIGPVFRDLAEFGRQLSDLKFPGYGQGGGPEIVVPGRNLTASSLEIPAETPNGKSRVFVLEQLPDQTYHLVDDFVFAGDAYLLRTQFAEGQLRYYDSEQRLVREIGL